MNGGDRGRNLDGRKRRLEGAVRRCRVGSGDVDIGIDPLNVVLEQDLTSGSRSAPGRRVAHLGAQVVLARDEEQVANEDAADDLRGKLESERHLVGLWDEGGEKRNKNVSWTLRSSREVRRRTMMVRLEGLKSDASALI